MFLVDLLEFSSAIAHSILVHSLHTDFIFADTVLQWFSSYLMDCTQNVSLSNHFFAFTPVHSDVPEGSVHGPIPFSMYVKPSPTITDSHSTRHHSFADDIHIQISAPPDKMSELLHSMQSCASDVKV